MSTARPRVLASGKGTSVLWAVLASGVMGVLGWLLAGGVAGESRWVLVPMTVVAGVWWIRQIRGLFGFHGLEAHPSGLRVVDTFGAWWSPWPSTRARFVPYEDIRGVTSERERRFVGRGSHAVSWIDIHTDAATIRVPDRLYDRDAEGLCREILDLAQAGRERPAGVTLDSASKLRRFSRPLEASRASPSSRLGWIAGRAVFAGIVAGVMLGLGYGLTWMGVPADTTYMFLAIGFVPVAFVLIKSKRPIAFLELSPQGIAIGRDRDRLERLPWSALAFVHARTHSSTRSLSLHERPVTSGLDLRMHDGRVFELRGTWTPGLDELAALLQPSPLG